MRLTGTWHGTYVYGPLYGPLASRAVPFTMSLTETWPRRIAGYVRDDATKGGMPERGRVLGRRRGTSIEFEKTMPNHYVMRPDGTLVSLSEAAAEQGVELPARMPPHRIRYEGTLSADGQQITGTWRIPMPGGSGEHGRGTWSARRTSELPLEV